MQSHLRRVRAYIIAHPTTKKINHHLNHYVVASFTLIEILIVISVVGTLSTAAISTVQGQNARARNIVRTTMINQIANSIAGYYSNNKYWPAQYCPTQIISKSRNPVQALGFLSTTL